MSRHDDLVQMPSQVLVGGRLLGLRLYAAIRTLRGHGPRNEAFADALERVRETLGELLPHGRGRLEVRFHGEVLMLNGAIVRARLQGAEQLADLSRILLERDVGGLRFERSSAVAALERWLVTFDQPLRSPEDVARVRSDLDRLAPLGLTTLAPKVLDREMLEVVKLSSLDFAIQTHARAVVAFREFTLALQDGRDPFLGKLNVVRIVQDLVDIVGSYPEHLVEVLRRCNARAEAYGRASGGYAPKHAAGICSWSVILGSALGLERLELLDLGTSGLLAKLGFALLPSSLTETQRALDPEEVRQLRLAMARAVEAFIAKSRLSDVMMRRVIVAYEHLRPFSDATGRPSPHPYSCVVAVADAYDAMVSDRPWRPALTEAAALDGLAQGAGTRFDPGVVRVLTELVQQGWVHAERPRSPSA